ncbi:MAG: hypothetical protein KDC27_03210, partial [Acidobacteria bacterium]|nr:hypothetical protein [Acidobacteriota bacterium]
MRTPWQALALALLVVGTCAAQGRYGDSLHGAAALRERGCTQCHAVLGRGGGPATDLTNRSFGSFSPAGFTAELWNHAPQMWSEMASQGRTPEGMTTQDMRDVFSFLYAVRFFEPAGDADRGRRVFSEKECHRCHALVRVEGDGIGPAVPDWPALTDPVLFLEAMWNHGALMEEETAAGKIRWPEMTERELADLLAYVNALPERPPRMGRLEMGSANAGMRLFDDLGCIGCHTILETDPDLIPLAPPDGRAYTL